MSKRLAHGELLAYVEGEEPPRFLRCFGCEAKLRHRPGNVYGCGVCGAFFRLTRLSAPPGGVPRLSTPSGRARA